MVNMPAKHDEDSTDDGRCPVRLKPDLRGTPTVEVLIAGALNAEALPQIRDRLDRAMARRPERLVIDLTDCGRFDATGMALLVETHSRLRDTGGRIMLRGLSTRLRRALEIIAVQRLQHASDHTTSPPATIHRSTRANMT
jgi:anti-anti-sigma factor